MDKGMLIIQLGILLLFLNLIDIITTQIGLSIGKCIVEANPFHDPRNIFHLIIKPILPMICVGCCYWTNYFAEKENKPKIQKFVIGLLIALNVFYLGVVINNLWVIFHAFSS